MAFRFDDVEGDSCRTSWLCDGCSCFFCWSAGVKRAFVLNVDVCALAPFRASCFFVPYVLLGFSLIFHLLALASFCARFLTLLRVLPVAETT
jgi:hypothetical protein